MSLLIRSQKNAADRVPDERDVQAEAFGFLRRQVQSLISVDDIVALQQVNPVQARTEVRAACRQAFGHVFWDEVSREDRERLAEALLDGMFGFGPLEPLLADDSVTEIMVNGPSAVFFERDGVIYRSDLHFVDDEQIRALMDRILGPLGRRVDEASPMVNARLPRGHRVNAVIPPACPDGPVLTIRKFSDRVLTLEDLEARGTMPASVTRFLRWAVRARKNIAVSGGTGAGKTTLLNALSCCIPHEERVITIEDSAELRFLTHPNVVRLEARSANAEGSGEYSIRDLLINALRMRPDRIVVGECRGAEALDMLQAMNTGHDGSLTTLHANSPREVVMRLTTMVRYAAAIPVDVVEEYICRALDVVVQMSRGLDGHRFISAVAEMSYDDEERCGRVNLLYSAGFERCGGGCARAGGGAEGMADGVEAGPEGCGSDGFSDGAGRDGWLALPSWPDRLPLLHIASEQEVREWKTQCLLRAS